MFSMLGSRQKIAVTDQNQAFNIIIRLQMTLLGITLLAGIFISLVTGPTLKYALPIIIYKCHEVLSETLYGTYHKKGNNTQVALDQLLKGIFFLFTIALFAWLDLSSPLFLLLTSMLLFLISLLQISATIISKTKLNYPIPQLTANMVIMEQIYFGLSNIIILAPIYLLRLMPLLFMPLGEFGLYGILFNTSQAIQILLNSLIQYSLKPLRHYLRHNIEQFTKATYAIIKKNLIVSILSICILYIFLWNLVPLFNPTGLPFSLITICVMAVGWISGIAALSIRSISQVFENYRSQLYLDLVRLTLFLILVSPHINSLTISSLYICFIGTNLISFVFLVIWLNKKITNAHF